MIDAGPDKGPVFAVRKCCKIYRNWLCLLAGCGKLRVVIIEEFCVSERIGKSPLRGEDLEVSVYVPSDEEVSDAQNFLAGDITNIDVADVDRVDVAEQSLGSDSQEGEKEGENNQGNQAASYDSNQANSYENGRGNTANQSAVNQDQKNGDVVLLSFDLDLNRGKNSTPDRQEQGQNSTVEQPPMSEQEQPEQQPPQEHLGQEQKREQQEQEQPAPKLSKRQERIRRREQAKQQEQAERASWYETLRRAAEAGNQGDWMSREEKVEAGLAKEYKSISPEEKLLQELRGDLEGKEGQLYEVQRYEFKSPEDVRQFVKAAAEVYHYEKNTVVGTQNLEVKLDSAEQDTWETRRAALINEQWKWVKDVLPDLPYNDKRDVQAVYLDFIEYLHQPGRERDGFTDYLEWAVPECKIEPSRENFAKLENGKVEMEEDLLSEKSANGENYYSDREIAAMLKMYDRAEAMTRYVKAMDRENGNVDSKSKRLRMRRRHDESEREGARSTAFKKLQTTSSDAGKGDVVEFPVNSEADDVSAGVFGTMEHKPLPNKIPVGNKSIDLDRLTPDEAGVQKLRDLADYCLERMRAAQQFNDERHITLAEKWQNDYLALVDNITLASITLADHRETQTKEQEKEMERRAVMREMSDKWKTFSAEEIVKRYTDEYELNDEQPIIEQLGDLSGKLRKRLSDAYGMKNRGAQAAYLDLLHQVNEVLVTLGADGQKIIQDSVNTIIA